MSSSNAAHSASASAVHSAMAIETVLNDQLGAILGPIGDIAVLWKIHDTVCKRIRALEKATRGKPKKERDPNAPKKEAGPQLLAWNAEVARVEAVSAGSKKGKLTYNHARAVAGRLKEAGLLNVKKDATVLPSDEAILKAVEAYYVEVNPESASAQADAKAGAKAKTGSKSTSEDKSYKKRELKEPVEPMAETAPTASSAPTPTASSAPTPMASSAPNPKKNAAATAKPDPKKAEKKAPEPVSMEPYDYIIDGKAYERLDINGYAFIWNEKGKYMGVYDEKKKAFDTSVEDPTM